MPNPVYENGLTLGIEIETEYIPSNNLKFKNWRNDHDASIISDYQTLLPEGVTNNILIERSSSSNKFFSLFPSSQIQTGDEFVSNVLNPDNENVEEILKELFKTLIENGEQVGIRSGIHFHISLSGVPVSVLKNLVKLWLRMEDMIYLMSGMGKVYRGYSNNCAYARPLSGEGIFIPHKGNYVQLVEIPKLLDSKSTREFLTNFGDSIFQSQGRYYPVRYYGLNLSNIYNRGAVEFRPLNMCLNYKWVYSALEFFRSMVNYSIYLQITKQKEIPFGENINSVYQSRDKEEILLDFIGIANELKLEPEVVSNLIKILELSEIPKLNPEGMASHLLIRSRINEHWQHDMYSPTILKSNPIKPTIDDIHSRRGG